MADKRRDEHRTERYKNNEKETKYSDDDEDRPCRHTGHRSRLRRSEDRKATQRSPLRKSEEVKQRRRTDSESSSSSSPDNRKSSKKHKRKRSYSTSSTDSSDKDSDHRSKKKKKYKDREKKKKEKSKKRKKKKSRGHSAVNQHKYGKYGILIESDMFSKQQEFYLWLMEVKKTNPETLPRFETKKMFETFMEDYNTATLPHKKFYDLEKWEAKQHQKGKLKAMKAAAENPKVAFGEDEEKHKSLHRTGKSLVMSRSELLEMQKVLRGRREDEYKRNAGLATDERATVRY